MRTFPPPRRGRKLSSKKIVVFIPVCQDIFLVIGLWFLNYWLEVIAQSNYSLLRWLLRRGSPLPIPNREVKPACADGTAILWESMSPPFFSEPWPSGRGSFFLWVRRPALRARSEGFLWESSPFIWQGFFFETKSNPASLTDMKNPPWRGGFFLGKVLKGN